MPTNAGENIKTSEVEETRKGGTSRKLDTTLKKESRKQEPAKDGGTSQEMRPLRVWKSHVEEKQFKAKQYKDDSRSSNSLAQAEKIMYILFYVK